MGHCLLRPVSIKDLQPVSPGQQIITDLPQCSSCLPGQERNGLLITIDPITDKIVGGVIPDFQDDIRHCIAEQHEIRRIIGSFQIIGTCGYRADSADQANHQYGNQ